jgi:membrane-bound serine protease (ClpP class)
MIFVWSAALVGLFLIYLEFFIPGAVMAIGGTVLLLTSVFLFHVVRPGVTHLVCYLIALTGAVFAVVRFAGWRLRQSKQESEESSGAKHLIGRVARAATDLEPSGHIFIDDQKYQALSQTGTICKGADVKIVGEQGSHLVVEIQSDTKPERDSV